MVFKEKVKTLRGRLGLSQKQLAENAGLGFRTVVSYESGERFPQSAQLHKLATALGVSTEYLRSDDIDDPSFGLEQMESARNLPLPQASSLPKESHFSSDTDTLIRQTRSLFSDRQISSEEKESYFQAVMRAYLNWKSDENPSSGFKRSSRTSHGNRGLATELL
ncbi:MAG: helix-turn-helix transcriptional regulator [Eubacterium sp.]|nr:helix-turn-helix transcriptional regulator [Eubacterium sp.]